MEASDASPELGQASHKSIPSLWRNRDYVMLWGGQTISTLGSGVSGIAFPLLILAMTKSPAAAGLAGGLRSLPYFFLSLPAGALIDRWDRKRVMLVCDIGRAIALASLPIALALGVLTVWQIYLTALIEGSLFVFFNIAEVAALPRVVTKAQLPNATSQNEAGFAISNIIGPSLGTLLYQSLGAALPFAFDAVSYVISVISLTLVKTDLKTKQVEAPSNLIADIRTGLSWLWHQPLVRFLAFYAGIQNLFWAGYPLIIIVLVKRLGQPDSAIGLVISAGAVGGVLGAVIAGPFQRRFTFRQVVVATAWLWVPLVVAYTLAPNVFLLAGLAFLMFTAGGIENIVQYSYRLALIPDELQGRVNSTWRMIAYSLQPLGALLTGILLQSFGPISTLWFFSIWLLGIALYATFEASMRRARP